jgi:outer membrane receptor protein involved in Fe transport
MKHYFLRGIAAIALTGVTAVAPEAAFAQSTNTVLVDIAEQDAATAIAMLAKQTGAQILISEDGATGRRTRAIRGRYTVEQALGRMLNRSGLRWGKTGPDSYSVVAEPSALTGIDEGLPDILVQGRRNWTLNTSIERSENDSQPFQVFDRLAIQQSGAPDIESFLRDQLSFNASPSTSEQAGGTNENRSSINLRGLGERETLILVDGRRLPSVNSGNGDITQPTISGIPLASIERIEVLASSASGIYGSGATGGVINIVLRRDYRGGDVTPAIGGTVNGGAGERRIDFNAALPVEEGRSTLTLTGSFRDVDPLLTGDRASLLVDGRRLALANDPAFFFFSAPLAPTANIVSAGRNPLVLKPQYGGQTLSSRYTFAPVGYRGLALDGVAPLTTNAGNLNLDVAPTAGNRGALDSILFASQRYALSLALRRRMNDWLSVYGEVSGNYSRTSSLRSRGPSSIFLSADAPNNPFQQTVIVSVAFPGQDFRRSTTNRQYRAIAGATIKLPADWQAVFDASRARNIYRFDGDPPGFDEATLRGFQTGAQDVLADRSGNPFSVAYLNSAFGFLQTGGRSDLLTLTGKLAGPLPFRLPGGRPILTLNVERNDEDLGSSLQAQNEAGLSRIDYTAPRASIRNSAYAELTFPIAGDEGNIPFVRELSFTLAARYDRYRETGSAVLECLAEFGPLPDDSLISQCPPPGAIIPEATAKASSVNPLFSGKWSPTKGLTIRGSYATGYLPPRLSNLNRVATTIFTDALDPARGNENIGTPFIEGAYFLPGFIGGNPDVRPETSTTYTLGAIVEPAFVPGFRFSIDWTKIRKKDNYYNPADLAFAGGDPATARALQAFIAQNPDRIVRGPASGGFAVGPITSIDLSTVNLSGSVSETFDFTGSYGTKVGSGRLELSARATLVERLAVQIFPTEPEDDYTGVVDSNFVFGGAAFGSMRWKGSGSLRWSNDKLSIGWQARYFGGYYLQLDRAIVLSQGSARVDSQIYHDLTGRYVLGNGFTVRAVVNNVFNKRPPYDISQVGTLYSRFGDPRLANFNLSLSKSF